MRRGGVALRGSGHEGGIQEMLKGLGYTLKKHVFSVHKSHHQLVQVPQAQDVARSGFRCEVVYAQGRC